MTDHTSWFEIMHGGELVEARVSYATNPGCPDTRECPGAPFSCEVLRAEVPDGDGWRSITLSRTDRDGITLYLDENPDLSEGGHHD